MARPFHNRGLTARKPKRYAGLVEQAEHLNVPDVLGRLRPEQRRTLNAYRVPDAPQVVLVRARKGVLDPWWWIVCPRCMRRAEALHRPNWSPEWLCRSCHGLQYASRRHGKSEQSFSRQMHRRNPAYRT